jgi:CubicO group peptidase (beta-lactamase class C family)
MEEGMDATTIAKSVFPGAAWKVEAPEAHGLSTEKLNAAAEAVKKIEKRWGFLVVKDGVIVHETYWGGDKDTKGKVFSVTKGFGASLIGIAQTQGKLSVKDKVSDWLPIHHPDIKKGATIEHVLSMTAGGDPEKDTFAYTSGPILNTLPNILQLATGRTPAEFYDTELAGPLGLTCDWPRTAKGWMQIGNQGPMPVLESTHRDLARLGLLWLNRGDWNGRRIIAQDFIDEALKAHFSHNKSYGYLWWINGASGEKGADGERALRIPTAPANVYQALGARGKIIFNVPDHNMVVVTLGDTGSETTPTQDLWRALEKVLA